jgi:hypothetical protein
MFAPRRVLAGVLLVASCGSAGKVDQASSGGQGGAAVATGGMMSSSGGAGGTAVATTGGVPGGGGSSSSGGNSGIGGPSGSGGLSGVGGPSSTGGMSGVGGTPSGGRGTAGASGSGGGAGTSGAPAQEQRGALPIARQEHGVGVANGEIYVVGGYVPALTPSVQAYTPATNTWRSVADFPDTLHHPNVAGVDGILYVTGFHNGGGRRVADGRVFAYDPATNKWTVRQPMPAGTERGASCVTTIGKKIYVFGGTNDLTLPNASIYDTQADSWEALPAMPALRQHCVAAVVDGKIFIVSGRDMGIEGIEAGSWVYDPVARTYAARAPIRTPRGGAAGGVLGGHIYVFGGEGNAADPSGIFRQAEVYDPVTDAWTALPDMLVPRHGTGGAVIGERIFIPGGGTMQGIQPSSVLTAFFLK